MGDFGRLATAGAKSKQVDRTKTDRPAPLFHESRLANLILEGPDTSPADRVYSIETGENA